MQVFLYRFPLPLFFCTRMSLSGYGAHLLDLTASGMWSWEERLLPGNTRSVLALATFLPQLIGQAVVLISNNATIVAYLRNQGGHHIKSDVRYSS